MSDEPRNPFPDDSGAHPNPWAAPSPDAEPTVRLTTPSPSMPLDADPHPAVPSPSPVDAAPSQPPTSAQPARTETPIGSASAHQPHRAVSPTFASGRPTPVNQGTAYPTAGGQQTPNGQVPPPATQPPATPPAAAMAQPPYQVPNPGQVPGAPVPPPPVAHTQQPRVPWAAPAAQHQGSFIDRVADGKLKDRALWITILRIVGWVALGLAFIFGIVSFFMVRSLGEMQAYFRGNNPYTGVAVGVMLMTWIGGAIVTVFTMVYANMAEDMAAVKSRIESRE